MFALGNQTILNTIWKFRMCYSKNYTQMRARRLILVLLVKKKTGRYILSQENNSIFGYNIICTSKTCTKISITEFRILRWSSCIEKVISAVLWCSFYVGMFTMVFSSYTNNLATCWLHCWEAFSVVPMLLEDLVHLQIMLCEPTVKFLHV